LTASLLKSESFPGGKTIHLNVDLFLGLCDYSPNLTFSLEHWAPGVYGYTATEPVVGFLIFGAKFNEGSEREHYALFSLISFPSMKLGDIGCGR